MVKKIETKSNEIIEVEDLDFNFKEELYNLPDIDIKSLKSCFQCITCTASCPIVNAFDIMPHQIMRMISLGMKEKVINCNTIWLCLTCYNCQQRCPQNVKVTDIFFALKNIAASNKLYPKSLEAFTRTIYEIGRSIEITDFQEDEREDLDLPEVEPFDPNKTKKIFNKTGIIKLFSGNNNGDEK
ncbi:MAG: 4Fe-4S dicluster domain-containing protein [Candidatus Helarchaeota archaeon]